MERYALFLTSLELSADITERKLALMRAREHGLDMERVVIVAAERTIERAFTVRSAAADCTCVFLSGMAGLIRFSSGIAAC